MPSAPTYLHIGKIASLSVFFTGLVYAVVTGIGLASLHSPHEVIPDPYFTCMEILTLLVSVLMLISMAAIHCYAAPGDKIYSLLALIFIAVMTVITSCVHFVVLTIGHTGIQQLPGFSFLFSFKWPSVVYVLDILAWDWFFPLSMLFAIPVFREGSLQKSARILMILSAALSFAGLAGVFLDNMQARNIGIIGYAVAGPFVFLLTGIIFHRRLLSV